MSNMPDHAVGRCDGHHEMFFLKNGNPRRIRTMAAGAQICDADHIRIWRCILYSQQQMHTLGANVMTSNYTGIVFFTVLGMLILLSAVYIPG